MRPFNRVAKYLTEFRVVDERRRRVESLEEVRALVATIEDGRQDDEEWRRA